MDQQAANLSQKYNYLMIVIITKNSFPLQEGMH